MNTLFGNNAVNSHNENKQQSTGNNNFQQSTRDEVDESPAMSFSSAPIAGSSPTAGLEPIDFDSVPDFKAIEYKDGHIDSGDEEWVDRKKCTMAEIAGKPIIIRGVFERTSKLYDGNKYISINFVNQQGEECFCNTSGATIKKQLLEKNMTYPFKTTIKACPKKDNPSLKYYKLS